MPPPRVVPLRTGKIWNPKFPEFANLRENKRVSSIETSEPSETGWVDAPATSHCHSFRYLDVRNYRTDPQARFVRKFGDFGTHGYNKGRSQLEVRFRGKNGQGIAAHYVYYFEDGERGQKVFEMLQASPHPYSEVVQGVLIAEKVPYEPIAR